MPRSLLPTGPEPDVAPPRTPAPENRSVSIEVRSSRAESSGIHSHPVANQQISLALTAAD
jgi:hypothetical protein